MRLVTPQPASTVAPPARVVGHEYCKTRIARCIECERLLADHEVRVCAECFSEAMSVPR